MAGSTYQRSRVTLAPAFLQERFGAAHQAAIGLVQDYLVDRAKQSVKARMPLLAPADALRVLGNERGIPRGPSESDAQYATRLQGAWDAWPWAGTPFGLLTQLKAAGFPAEIRIQNAVRYYLDVNGALVVEARPNEWLIDTVGSTFWSRFVVVIDGTIYLAYLAGVASVVAESNPAYIVPELIGASAYAIADARVRLVDGGGEGGALFTQYQTSINGGSSWSPVGTVHNAPFGSDTFDIGAWSPTGLQIQWHDAYWAGDEFSFAVALVNATPANGSNDANRAKAIERAWKPGHATCSDIIVITSGRTWGTHPSGATWVAQLNGRTTWGSDLATPTHWSP